MANPGGRRRVPTLTHPRSHSTLSPRGTDPTAALFFPFGGFCFPFGKPPEMHFSPGRDIPRCPRFASLCRQPRSAPGTALRSCPVAPDRTGDMRGHPSPIGARRNLEAIPGAPGGLSCACAPGVLRVGPPHPHPRCVAAEGGQLVVVAFKKV